MNRTPHVCVVPSLLRVREAKVAKQRKIAVFEHLSFCAEIGHFWVRTNTENQMVVSHRLDRGSIFGRKGRWSTRNPTKTCWLQQLFERAATTMKTTRKVAQNIQKTGHCKNVPACVIFVGSKPTSCCKAAFVSCEGSFETLKHVGSHTSCRKHKDGVQIYGHFF